MRLIKATLAWHLEIEAYQLYIEVETASGTQYIASVLKPGDDSSDLQKTFQTLTDAFRRDAILLPKHPRNVPD